VLPKPWDAVLAALLGVALPVFVLNSSGSRSFTETSGTGVTPVLFCRDTNQDVDYISSITCHLVSGTYHDLTTRPGTDNCLLSSRGVFLLQDRIDRSYLIGTVSLSLGSRCFVDDCLGFVTDDYVQPSDLNLQSSGVEFSGFSDVLKSANLALRLSFTFTDLRFISSHTEEIVTLMKACFESSFSTQVDPSEKAFGGHTILFFSYAYCTEDIIIFMNHCKDAPDRTLIAVILPSLSSENRKILTSYPGFKVRSAFRLAGSDPVSEELMLVLHKIGSEPASESILSSIASVSEKIRFFALNMILYETGDLAKIGFKRSESYKLPFSETHDFIPSPRGFSTAIPPLKCFPLTSRTSEASTSMKTPITPSLATEEGNFILLPAKRSTCAVVVLQPVEVPISHGIQNAMSFNTDSTAPGFLFLNSIKAFIDSVSSNTSVFPFTSTILLDVFRNSIGGNVYLPTKNCAKMSVEYFAQRIRSGGEPLNAGSSFELAQLLRHISNKCPVVPERCTSSAVIKWRSFLSIQYRERSPTEFTFSETTKKQFTSFLECNPSWWPSSANHTLVFPLFEIQYGPSVIPC
jgi:hypothetical protein